MSKPDVLTSGDIARTLGRKVEAVRHVLASRPDLIQPVGRAGLVRLYQRSALDAVRAELDAIAARRRRQAAS